MKHLTLTFAIVATLACNNFVVGQLYDAPPVGDINSFVDQDFPDVPEFSAYIVDDVEFTADVTIGSVTTYFTFDSSGDGTPWPADDAGMPFTAILNIFPDDGTLDTEDPAAGTVVDVTVEDNDDDGDGFIQVTACGLSIDLAAGTYWIGMTPTIDFGIYGQEFHPNSAGIVGSEAFIRNPGGGFALPTGTAWGAISVNFNPPGTPADVSMTILDEVDGACPTKGCDFAIGDVNQDGAVNLVDVQPFVDLLVSSGFQCEADINEDGAVDLLDVDPFVTLLGG